MLYSNTAGVVTWTGGRATLTRGQSIDDEHPLVAERPDLFTDEEPGPSIGAPVRVQTTMQRPGEVRTERGPAVVKAPPRRA